MRLRSVRMKDGGATIRVLHTPMPNVCEGQPENFLGKIVEHAKHIGGMDEEGSRLDGFIMIGMFSDGTTSIGYRVPERLPRSLLPAYIAEIVRRDIITDREAERVFDEKFEWVES